MKQLLASVVIDMKGHEPLIHMRMSGKAPQCVSIEDHRSLNSHDWHLFGEIPTISVYGDELYDIDLRFCVDLIVSISSFSETRAKTLFLLAKSAKARVITSCVLIPDAPHWMQTGWSDIHIQAHTST
jgi:hypothetical protein